MEKGGSTGDDTLRHSMLREKEKIGQRWLLYKLDKWAHDTIKRCQTLYDQKQRRAKAWGCDIMCVPSLGRVDRVRPSLKSRLQCWTHDNLLSSQLYWIKYKWILPAWHDVTVPPSLIPFPRHHSKQPAETRWHSHLISFPIRDKVDPVLCS